MSPYTPPKPALRVQQKYNDVWTFVRTLIETSRIQPVINLGQGFFGWNPPDNVREAAVSALSRVDCNQYAPTRGRPRLLEALANSYSPLFGRMVDPAKEILVTTGANYAAFAAMLAFVNPGEEIALVEPFFDQYVTSAGIVEAKLVSVPLRPPKEAAEHVTSAAEWTFDVDELDKVITPKTKMLIINSPHNPVGKVFTREELVGIARIVAKNPQLIVISDEVYDRLFYEPFYRLANLGVRPVDSAEDASIIKTMWERTITIGSGGKTFYATGWRVGWAIGSDYFIKHMLIAQTRTLYSGVGPLQEAAAVGLEDAEHNGFWEEARSGMLEKVNFVGSVLEELGLPYSRPGGGYFILVNTKRVKIPTNLDMPEDVRRMSRDYQFVWFMVNEIGLAGIPPSEFYSAPNKALAEDWVRLSICKPMPVLEDAARCLRKLKKYIV